MRSTDTMSRDSSTTHTTRGSRRSSRAERAQLGVGDVEAAGAEAHLRLGVADRRGEAVDVVGGDLEQVEGDALGRLRPDAGQAAELVDQRLDRRGVGARHVRSPARRARTPGTPRRARSTDRHRAGDDGGIVVDRRHRLVLLLVVDRGGRRVVGGRRARRRRGRSARPGDRDRRDRWPASHRLAHACRCSPRSVAWWASLGADSTIRSPLGRRRARRRGTAPSPGRRATGARRRPTPPRRHQPRSPAPVPVPAQAAVSRAAAARRCRRRRRGGVGRRRRRRRLASARRVAAARSARPPSRARPVVGSTGGDAAAGAAAPDAATWRSSSAMRAVSASTSPGSAAPASARASCTSATSTQHPRVGRVAQLDQHLAEALDRPHERGRAESLALRGQGVDLARRRQLHQLGRHQRQEPVAQVADELLGHVRGSCPALTAWAIAVSALAGVVVDQRLDELVEAQVLADVAAGAGDQLERRQGVARRAAALARRRPSMASSPTSSPASAATQRTCSASVSGAQQVEAAGAGCGCGSCR